MGFRSNFVLLPVAMLALYPPSHAWGQSTSSSSSSSAQHARKAAPAAESRLDAGSLSNGVYRNPSFGFTCKIPAGWVLRTEEMNAREGEDAAPAKNSRAALRAGGGGCPHTSSCVLLAAFSRPPAARGEDVNSSILIAAESASSYP